MNITIIKPFGVFFGLLMAFGLAGCGKETTPSAIFDTLNKGNANKALGQLKAPLAISPEHGVLNALALSASWEKCVKTACFTDTDSDLLADMRQFSRFATLGISIDDVAINFVGRVTNSVNKVLAMEGVPSTVVVALKALPDKARKPLTSALAHSALTAIQAGEVSRTVALLHPITREDVFTKADRHLASYMYGRLVGQDTFAKANLVALKANKKRDSSAALWGMLPYVWQSAAPSREVFMDRLLTETMALKTAFSPEGLEAFTNTLNTLARQLPDDSVDKAYMYRLSVQLTPTQEDIWKAFLPAMGHALQEEGGMGVLAGLSPITVPTNLRASYNSVLFNMVEPWTSQNKDGLPLLKQLAVQSMPKTEQIRLEKTVRAGLDIAVDKGDIPAILAYAEFKPEVAKNTRRTIVPAMVTYIKEAFSEQKFDEIERLGIFLQKDLDIDFDLNALLLQTYETELRTKKVASQLSAEVVDWLQKPLEKAKFDLGPAFVFLQKRFEKDAGALNNVLKGLVTDATGTYGTAVAFYRLMPWFDDKMFKPSERMQYLRAAIRNSLLSAGDLSAAELATLGMEMNTLHGLNLSFVAEEAIARAYDLEEGRKVWAVATEELKQALGTAMPPFYTLMSAIDAYDAGKKAKAAKLFTKVNTAFYLKQAAPYLAHYANTVDKAIGWYVPTRITAETPLAYIGINTATAMRGAALTQLRVTLINRVGALKHKNPKSVTENHGVVYKATLEGELDFDNNQVIISTSERNNVVLPLAFEEAFGAVATLAIKEDTLHVYLKGSSRPLAFVRVGSLGAMPLFPDGRYSIVGAVQALDNTTKSILPKGSLLTLKTDQTAPVQLVSDNMAVGGIIYEVGGKVGHPLSAVPLKLSGFYAPEKHLVQFTFNYPLSGENNTATAVVRCQVLAKNLVCGLHNQHADRLKFTRIIRGEMTKSSYQASQNARKALVGTLNTKRKEAKLARQAAILEAKEVAAAVSASLAVSASMNTSVTNVASPTVP